MHIKTIRKPFCHPVLQYLFFNFCGCQQGRSDRYSHTVRLEEQVGKKHTLSCSNFTSKNPPY